MSDKHFLITFQGNSFNLSYDLPSKKEWAIAQGELDNESIKPRIFMIGFMIGLMISVKSNVIDGSLNLLYENVLIESYNEGWHHLTSYSEKVL